MTEVVVDELFALRNLLYMGSYQQVINEATNPSTTPRSESVKTERRVLLYRAYVAQQKYNLVLSEIESSAPVELRAVRALAAYLQNANSAASEGREVAVQTMREFQTDPAFNSSPILQLQIATVMYHEGLYEEALKILVKSRKNLECLALLVQTYLTMNRLDLAKTEIQAMKSWSEDAPLSQLIEGWVNLKSGGDSYQQAFYMYEELGQSSSASTVKMLNGKAVSNLLLGRFPEAESILLEALNKDHNDPETLVNLIVCSNHLLKPADVITRYTNQLKDIAPKHVFLQDLDLKESLFDRNAARFALVK